MHRSSQFIKSTTFEQYNVLCTLIGLHNRTEMLTALHPFEHILDLHQSNPRNLKVLRSNKILSSALVSEATVPEQRRRRKGETKMMVQLLARDVRNPTSVFLESTLCLSLSQSSVTRTTATHSVTNPYMCVLVSVDNTHCWWQDHCTAGLQFYKFGLYCFTTQKKQHIFFVGPVLLICRRELYSDPYPNGEFSLH